MVKLNSFKLVLHLLGKFVTAVTLRVVYAYGTWTQLKLAGVRKKMMICSCFQ